MANEREILSGLRDLVEFHQGDHTDVTVTRVVPDKVNMKAIRNQLGLSQNDFSRIYELPVSTLRNWEQGRRHLEGAARLMPLFVELVDVIKSDPAIADAISKKIREKINSEQENANT